MTGKNRCVTCGGCLQELCFNHLTDHRQELNKQLDEVGVTHDRFSQTLTEQTSDLQKHPLIQQIDKWEHDSITKIRQTAIETRKKIIEYTTEWIKQIEIKLNTLTQQLRQSREENDFYETDLRHWDEEFTRLTKELAKSSNINIREDTTTLINKISVDIVSDYNKLDVEQSITMPCGASDTLNETSKYFNAPKRPLSAFFLFSQDERPDLKKENPSMSAGDISKEIGARWKKASDDVKKCYEQKANIEREKYEARLSEYKKSVGDGRSNSKSLYQHSKDDDDDED